MADGVTFYLLIGEDPPGPETLLDVSVGPWGLVGSPRADQWLKLHPGGTVEPREMSTDLIAATWWATLAEAPADLPNLGKLRLAGPVRDYPFGARWVRVVLNQVFRFKWDGSQTIGPGLALMPFEDARLVAELALVPGVAPVLVSGGDVTVADRIVNAIAAETRAREQAGPWLRFRVALCGWLEELAGALWPGEWDRLVEGARDE